MERIWLRSYPPGVPADVDCQAYSSLVDILLQSCSRFRELPALSNMGGTITYGELDRLTAAFSAYLQSLGLVKGDRVALMMPNILQYPVALFGALRAGCVVVNTNPLYTARELSHQIRDSGAKAIVVLENFAHTVEQVLPDSGIEHVVTTRIGDLLPFPKGAIANLVVRYVKQMVPSFELKNAVPFKHALGIEHSRPDVPLAREDLAFLQYTGGTTGVPKGAMLTHGNLVANLQQTAAWIGGVLEEGKETVVTPLPLYHVFSLTANLLVFMKLGAHNVLITNPRDLPGFLKELARTPFTAITGVNTLFNGMLNAKEISMVKPEHLKVAVGGGMAVQRAVAERWKTAFGVPIVEGYGLTEASPIVCANRLDATAYSGKIGLPVPSTEVAIRDEKGLDVPIGEIGEICVRGPQVMRGYWNRPVDTAEVLASDGWLRTGDMGFMDQDGYVALVDRKKDMIVVSGFKVFPNEIEDVAAMHPGVLESAAIPMHDDRSGLAVRLVVVRRDPALTEAALIEHCRKNLTGYKVPREIVFRAEPLPKSNIGKILRRQVREEEGQATAG
ncbi:MAG: AMP-binding protein [Burkholderiales bacterium]